MPLGQMVCGTERCFIPLAGPIGRQIGTTPTICHQHTRGLIHITRNCSSQERQTFHTSTMSPCLIHNAHGRSRTTPAQEKLNFVVLVQLLLNGGGGMWDRPASPTQSRWGSGQGQGLGGLPRALHPCTVPIPAAADASPFPKVLVEQAETLL